MSLKVYAPVSGKVVPVTEVPDPVFSDKGKGILQAAGLENLLFYTQFQKSKKVMGHRYGDAAVTAAKRST